MKVIKKAGYLLCCLAIALIMTGTIKGTASAEAEIASIDSFISSPLHPLYKTSDDPEVKIASYEPDILRTDTHTLTLKNVTEDMEVTFKSSDSSILTVKKKTESSCTYTGIGYGTAEITITVRTGTILFFWSDTTTLKAEISVTPHATSIKCVKQKLTIVQGKKANLELTIRPSISAEVPVFQSKDKEICTINEKGKITAKEVGVTYVTATIANGKSTRCQVTVKK